MSVPAIDDVYELSPMQQGMLFHSLAAPEAGVYQIHLAYGLKGQLDAAVFAQAWRFAFERHAILRTSFHWQGLDKPVQVVHRAVELPFVEYDWQDLAEDQREERLADFLKAERQRAIPLGRSPLSRLALVRTGPESYCFFWSFHHILMEGWSASLVLGEVFAAYRAFLAGGQPRLEPRRPYRDYLLWVQGRDPKRAEEYWRKRLAGFVAPTPLAVDRPVAAGTDAGAPSADRRQLHLSVETDALLRSLARQHQITLATVMQGAWALLLSRYSGEHDVVFGNVVSGRGGDLEGIDAMVGLLVNTLPARVGVDREAPVLAWLKALQTDLAEMREHEQVSLISIQGWSEVPRGKALFESIFAFENWAGEVSRLHSQGDLETTEFAYSDGGYSYPLVIAVSPGPPLSVQIAYDRQRFAASAIERMLEHYRRLLEAVAQDPRRRVCEVEMLPAAERQLVVATWNDTRREEPPVPLVRQFEERVRESPGALAVASGESRLSYDELNRRANQWARHLRRLGVGPEVRVGVCAERSADQVVGLLAILKAGGAYVPFDPGSPTERLRLMLEDSGLSVLLTQERIRPGLPGFAGRVVSLDGDREDVGRESGTDLGVEVAPSNLAYVIYTSGSTGRPKGVEVTQAGLLNLVSWHRGEYEVAARDRATLVATPAFDASVWELWPYLASGASVHVPDEETRGSASLLTSWLQREGITLCFLPTPLAEAVLGEPWPAASSLRALLTGGDRLHGSSLRAVPFRLVNHYGPTEASVVSTFSEVERGGGPGDPPIGRPLHNATAYVLDRWRNPVPIGVPGELYVGGAGVARGYLGRPDLTAERFVPDAFSSTPGARLYRTGDLVRYREDGQLEFLDRIDQQVKVRGFRIELGEVESALLGHPEVKEAVVVTQAEGETGQRLVAYVVPERGSRGSSWSDDANDPLRARSVEQLVPRLRGHLEQTLPGYMVPGAILVLESLPLTPNGKVDRRALPAPHDRPELEAGYLEPRSPVEEAVAAVWRDVLGVEKVGVHDNFFEVGGHSLRLVQVHDRLRALFPERPLPVVDLFRHPTIESLAAHLSAGPGSAPQPDEDTDADAERRVAGRERLGRRRGVREALVAEDGADA